MTFFRRARYTGLTRVCVALVVLNADVHAGELTKFRLEPEADGYRMNVQGLILAPKAAVWRVLTDYAELNRISPRITESELVESNGAGISRVRTLNRLCFLAFCRDLRHVQLIRERTYGDFESDSVAAESDLSRGHARWRLESEGAATRLVIDFRFAMDSYAWVPSFVTHFVARSVLKEDAEALINGIEQASRHRKIRIEDERNGG